MIAKSFADRKNDELLAIGGRMHLGQEAFPQSDVRTMVQTDYVPGRLRIASFAKCGSWAFAPAMLWRLRHQARDADFITLHSLYSFPVLAGYLLARLYRKPYGLWPHGALLAVQRKISARRKRVYDWLFARRILSHASVIFFSGVDEREEALELGLTAPCVLIPHGFDSSEFESLPPRGSFRAKYLHGHEGPLVLYLSRLNRRKGLDLLVEAFALVIRQAPNARLAIVGSGDPPGFESQVRDWLHQRGVERCSVMTGLLIGQQKLEAFADADVFVLPSLAENFGFAMFEAMASRVPVVVSDTLDYAGEVQRYGAGLVVRRDAQEFANGIVTLLGNADLRQRVGQNGLLMARAFSWEKCGQSIERTLACVLQGKPPPVDLTRREPRRS
jgi:glycosyltransferase involved in cell wall biosynthesis